MPLSDGTQIYVAYAIAGPDGLIRRTGVTEEAMVGMQGTEPDDIIIAHTSDPAFGVIDVEVTPEIDDETHYWDGTAFQLLPARPSEPHYWDGVNHQWIVRIAQPNIYCTFDEVSGHWVDSRDEAQVFNALHHERMRAEIATGLAIHKLVEVNAYSMAEVANDAVGIPATIREFIDLPDFPQLEKDLMLAYFKTMPTMPRSMTRVFGPIHPDDPGDGYPSFIPWLASAKGITITPEQIDTLWGVNLPPPLYVAPSP